MKGLLRRAPLSRSGHVTHLSQQRHETRGGHDAHLPRQGLSDGRTPLLLTAAVRVRLGIKEHKRPQRCTSFIQDSDAFYVNKGETTEEHCCHPRKKNQIGLSIRVFSENYHEKNVIVERYNVILSPSYSSVAAMRFRKKHGVYFSSWKIFHNFFIRPTRR